VIVVYARKVVRRRVRFTLTEDQQREKCGNKRNGVCFKIEKLSARTKSQYAMSPLPAKDVPCTPESDASWWVRMPETSRIAHSPLMCKEEEKARYDEAKGFH
jgi:hypothetical protein